MTVAYLSLNDYWRGCIEAGPIEPPLLTLAYKTAEFQFGVWEVEDAIATKLAPAFIELARQFDLAADALARSFMALSAKQPWTGALGSASR